LNNKYVKNGFECAIRLLLKGIGFAAAFTKNIYKRAGSMFILEANYYGKFK